MGLQALRDAVREGTNLGALVHEKSGVALAAEVVAVEDVRVLAVARVEGADGRRFCPKERVRLELPREASVVCAWGCVARSAWGDGVMELEIDCPDGAEDRQRRMDVRADVECLVRFVEDGEWLSKRTANLSAGGALVADGDPAHPGDLLDVELHLDGETVRCRAEVVRRGVKTGGVSSRTNAAIRFLGLSPATRERLAVWVLSAQAREKASRHPAPHRAPRPADEDEAD
jgi:hypothetical protein